MGFRIGFHKTLLKMGKWRFGIGYSTRGAAGLIMLLFFGIFNLMWYMILGMLWIIYGVIWLVFVLPVKAVKKFTQKTNNTDSSIELDK